MKAAAAATMEAATRVSTTTVSAATTSGKRDVGNDRTCQGG
jgi:hypothetical protein